MSDLSEMKIVNVPIGDVKPYPNNPRKNDEAVDGVMNSIKEFGFNSPILLDKDSVIVCGHTRHRAAQKLGMTEVPCVYLTDLSEDKIRAYRLADNKVSEAAEWDMKKLEKELNALANIQIDMSVFGFGEDDDNKPEDKPEVEFTEELLEEHNYLVLFCNNSVDWLQVESFFDLKTVKALDSKPGFSKMGVGRVLNASEFMTRVLKVAQEWEKKNG
jgi:hypothetical protein